MINPASLSFKGKVYYNTNTENSRGWWVNEEQPKKYKNSRKKYK